MHGVEIEAARRDDGPAVAALLTASGLPTEGALECIPTAVVARRDGRIVGFAALEFHADGVLLRSVVVDATERSTGIGRALIEAALSLAATPGAADVGRGLQPPASLPVFLLTETAADYFPRFGFEVITRDDVPPGVRQAGQFHTCCCTTAVVMRHANARGPRPSSP
jgi:amino-acid N-acetyltransferase